MRTARIVLALLAVVLMASTVFAQEKDQKEGRRGGRRGGEARQGPMGGGIMFMLRDLKLTDEQKEKVAAISKKYGMDSILTDEQKKARAEALEAAKKAGKSEREAGQAAREAVKLTDEQRTKMMASMRTMMEEVQKILTDDQKAQLKKRMEERRRPEGGAKPEAKK